MTEVDRFFNSETKAIAVDSSAIAKRAAYELQSDVLRQIRQNFRNPSVAFMKGVKVYEFDDATIVRLASPILSSYAEDVEIQGSLRSCTSLYKTSQVKN